MIYVGAVCQQARAALSRAIRPRASVPARAASARTTAGARPVPLPASVEVKETNIQSLH